MALWNLAESILRARRLDKEHAALKAAEETAKDEVERPPYTPDEERDVRQLWSEPIAEKDVEELTITSHIERYIDARTPEQLKTFARLLLKHGFDLPSERANQLAEIVAQNRDRLKGGFYNIRIRRPIVEKLSGQKNGPERNVTAVVLSQPKKFVDVFENFFKRPPGGKPFLSPEEWEHGKMPLKRRSGPSTI